ncbi:hypothetical protein L7F22_007328 [Adiantum nelumboides]|nr:hypothetical protein [Adiantum nelumboides]
MGKVLHKLIHGILPSCVFTSFLKPKASSRRLPYLKLRQSVSTPAAASPQSPSSPDHGLAMEIEQGTYYYSYSEDDNGNLSMAGYGEPSPVSIERTASDSPHNGNSCCQYISEEFQHGIHHHHHCHCICQQHEDFGQQYDDSQHDRQHVHCGKLRGDRYKRKSFALDEWDDEIERNNGGNVKPKRQKTANVSYELPECISEIVGRGRAIVQYSYNLQEPQHAFRESMVDMIVSNGLWDESRQESLLLCYLTLNDPHLCTTICASFFQALEDLHSSLVTP